MIFKKKKKKQLNTKELRFTKNEGVVRTSLIIHSTALCLAFISISLKVLFGIFKILGVHDLAIF